VRIELRWWLVAVGSPIALFGIGIAVSRLTTGDWPDFTRIGEVSFLGNIGFLVLPLWVLTFGFGEEVGWRGFALQHLQPRLGALRATLLIAAVWVTWHIPSFFYLPTYLELGLGALPGFAIGLTLGAVLLTWLYNGSGASIAAVAMWHALYDLFSASGATDVVANTAMSAVITLWALFVLVLQWRGGHETFAGYGRATASAHGTTY
jgi:membrane protease YdiL (CAAX protease family)